MPAPIEQELTSDCDLGPSGHGTRVPRPGAASLAPKTSGRGRVSFQVPLVEMIDGSNHLRSNRLVAGLQLSRCQRVPPAVTTAITFVSNALPPNYAVFVDAAQTDVFASVSSKTTNGFNIVITRLDRE
jgi:hypothetical protein